MQVDQSVGDVVELALTGDEACCRVHNWLKWTQIGSGDAVQYTVAIVDTSSVMRAWTKVFSATADRVRRTARSCRS